MVKLDQKLIIWEFTLLKTLSLLRSLMSSTQTYPNTEKGLNLNSLTSGSAMTTTNKVKSREILSPTEKVLAGVTLSRSHSLSE